MNQNEEDLLAPSNEPLIVKRPPPPKKRVIVGLSIFMLSGILFALYGIFFEIKSFFDLFPRSSPIPQDQITETPSTTSEPEIPANKIYTFKEDGIYATNLVGQNSEKVFDLKEEEQVISNAGYEAKLSPNRRYLAYNGSSGGLDSALKVIDLDTQKKVTQGVFGSASITAFAWSPQSDALVLAVSLKNEAKDFDTNLYQMMLEDEKPYSPLFTPENIEITSVAWPIADKIYYSRISHAKDTANTISIVSFDVDTKTRKVTDIISWSQSNFWLTTNPAENNLLWYAYVSNKAPAEKMIAKAFHIPSMTVNPIDLGLSGNERNVVWIENYVAGIRVQSGSPDSSVFVFNTETKQSTQVLDMGPSGSFHDIKIVEDGQRRILLVWSEFDDEHSVYAYDLDLLVAAREKAETDGLLWKLEGARSPTF